MFPGHCFIRQRAFVPFTRRGILQFFVDSRTFFPNDVSLPASNEVTHLLDHRDVILFRYTSPHPSCFPDLFFSSPISHGLPREPADSWFEERAQVRFHCVCPPLFEIWFLSAIFLLCSESVTLSLCLPTPVISDMNIGCFL